MAAVCDVRALQAVVRAACLPVGGTQPALVARLFERCRTRLWVCDEARSQSCVLQVGLVKPLVEHMRGAAKLVMRGAAKLVSRQCAI